MNLNEIIQTPDIRTFKYRADGVTGVEVMEDGASDEPILELTVRYASPRQYREMLTEGIDVNRKATSRKGIKAITVNEDRARRTICRRLIKGWRLTVEGAYALELEGNLSGMPRTKEIAYNEENLGAMIDKSQLPGVINELMTDHSKWFDEPEDDVDPDSLPDDPTGDTLGNSGGGPKTSSGE